MSPQMSSAASCNIPHGLILHWAKGMTLPVVFSMEAEDLRYLKGWFFHELQSFLGGLVNLIKGTYQFIHKPVCYVGVAESGTNRAMTKENLKDTDIGTILH